MNSDSDLTDLSSELSSVRSSPSPPPTFGYPSPQSSQDNSANVSDSQQRCRKRSLDAEDLPVPKKRKSFEAKPRRTDHLDLRSPPLQPAVDQSAQLNLLLKTLRKRRKIVVIAGAGISTSAGGEFFILHCLHSILLTSAQCPTSARPMVFSIHSRAKTSLKPRASTSSMLLFTRQMTPLLPSMRWCELSRHLSAMLSPRHFIRC